MNNRQKMYQTNSKIKEHLSKLGFKQLYLFPHLRFSKDYILEGQGFDAIGFKVDDKRIYFLQFKSNKKPSKQTLIDYKAIENKYYVKCLWVNRVKKEIIISCSE